jgi:hypothetical protein
VALVGRADGVEQQARVGVLEQEACGSCLSDRYSWRSNVVRAMIAGTAPAPARASMAARPLPDRGRPYGECGHVGERGAGRGRPVFVAQRRRRQAYVA